jgi:hypothetical protein
MSATEPPQSPGGESKRAARFGTASLVCHAVALLWALVVMSMNWSGGGGASGALAMVALILIAPSAVLALVGIGTSFIALTKERDGPIPVLAAAVSFALIGYVLEALIR